MRCFVFAVAAVYLLWEVSSENCPTSDPMTCVATSCVGGIRPICINGICTCADMCRSDADLGPCRSDCLWRLQTGRMNCSCLSMDLHCIDGDCHCVHLKFP